MSKKWFKVLIPKKSFRTLLLLSFITGVHKRKGQRKIRGKGRIVSIKYLRGLNKPSNMSLDL